MEVLVTPEGKVVRSDALAMVENEGIYIVSDRNDDSAIVVILSRGGKLYALSPDSESLDPSGFYGSAVFHQVVTVGGKK